MRTLLIDNYDSFSFNLWQLLARVNGEPPLVVRNDAAPWSVVRRLPFDNVVISPGPGRPDRPGDFGICRDAILEGGQGSLPLLGVCLGHQGLCWLAGGSVERADVPMHGRPSAVRHLGNGLFEGLPSPFTAIRYHSLVVPECPEGLRANAWTEDGLLMGVEHPTRPLFGVQFHPESIGTEHGERLIENFRERTVRHWAEHGRDGGVGDGSESAAAHALELAVTAASDDDGSGDGGSVDGAAGRTSLRVHARRLERWPDPERALEELRAASGAAEERSFWLDSAQASEDRRCSFLGVADGPLDELVTYAQAEGAVRVQRGGRVELEPGTVFEFLERSLARREVEPAGLPFAFQGGYVGYLGYELEADTAARRRHRAASPDAGFLGVHRFLAFDHGAGEAWAVCVDEPGEVQRAEAWLERTAAALAGVPSEPRSVDLERGPRPEPRLRHSAAAYLERIRDCQAAIRDGESYELCLTNRLEFDLESDPWSIYRALRAGNPAPFAAWLELPGLSVLSASPERFLSVDAEGGIEAKPIKGTRPRGATPEEDRALIEDLATAEKDRAENLIIIDLLRNDIGRVAEVGSVHVPQRFEVESYATVHQLVSTVRGRLRAGLTAVHAVRAAFPGGSMTGAPKRRTVELLEELEGGPRGVYSGALGYFSFTGPADLSIVIRTIVVEGETVSVGVGGAIVAASDPEQELGEMLLKAEGSIAALAAVEVETREAAR